MQIKLKELTIAPAIFLTAQIVMVCMALADAGFQGLSYATLLLVLLGFVCMLVMYAYEGEMTRFGLLSLLFMSEFIAVSIMDGHDVKNAIYLSVETWLPMLIMNYYCDRMKMVVIVSALVFSLCIYANLAHFATNPDLWIVSDEKAMTGYLLGNNYNQMGIRMLVALATNLLCLKFSKWWLLNIIPLALAIIIPLVVVHSMTALSCIIMLMVFALIPFHKLQRLALLGLFIAFLLFQVFVVFSGKGLENNELAVYFIEDVLDKDITFTNRTHMWDTALRAIADSPIVGFGLVDEDWFRSHMTNFAMGPHNFILALLIYGGIVHLALYIAICFTAWRSIAPCHDRMATILLFAVVTMMVMMLMEMYPHPLVMFMITLVYYYRYISPGNAVEDEEDGTQQAIAEEIGHE